MLDITDTLQQPHLMHFSHACLHRCVSSHGVSCVCGCCRAGAADNGCHVWGLQGLLPSGGSGGSSSSSSGGLSTSAQLSRLLASQRTSADVGAMAFDPTAELLCAGHKDGAVSVWNCSYSTQCSTIYE